MPGSTGTVSDIAGKGGGVQARAFLFRRHRKYLGRSQHLAKALVLAKVKGLARAVVDAVKDDGAAVGEAKLVAAEGRKPAWIRDRGVVEVVSGVEGRVAHEFEEGAVEAAAPRSGDDIGKAGGAAADLCRHPPGLGLNLLHCVHVEVAERGAAHLGVADVGPVHGKGRFDAALAVDGELLGEVGGPIGVGHGAGRQQQQLAEVTLVQRKLADGLAGEVNAAGSLLLRWQAAAVRALPCRLG